MLTRDHAQPREPRNRQTPARCPSRIEAAAAPLWPLQALRDSLSSAIVACSERSPESRAVLLCGGDEHVARVELRPASRGKTGRSLLLCQPPGR